jgi:DNA-binding MarR family transcriptional regulator
MTAGSPVMSADLQSALFDIARWLYHGFFLPGDQLSSASPGSLLSGLVSTAIWLSALASILVIYRSIRDLDRALTAFLVRLYEELRRSLRVVARRLSIAFRSYALERQARLTRTEVFEQPALSALQLRILQAHVGLPPAHLLTPTDVARSLDMRPADVAVVLGTLRKLSLVDRTRGADDGEDGYRLTKAGEVFLAACSRQQKTQVTPPAERALRPKRIEPRLGSV